MQILVIGCGKQGSTISNELLKEGFEVTVADNSPYNLEKFKGASKELVDINDLPSFKKLLQKFKFAVNALPSKFGAKVIKLTIEQGVNLVDVSFLPEDVFTFHNSAQNAGVTIITDCGVAPGLSNICAGNAYKRFKKPTRLKIYVGGVPQQSVPPLNLCVTFCPEDLFEEYTRKVRIKENGIIKEVPPLSGIEAIEFEINDNKCEFECFYTDGLRTLLRTIDIPDMFEKTIRYKGHAKWIKSQSPEELLKILKEYSTKEIKDMMLFRVKAESSNGTVEYEFIDFYDDENKLTAMARTTSYTAVIITRLLLGGKIKKSGIVTPEELGMDEKLFEEIINALSNFNINLKIKQ